MNTFYKVKCITEFETDLSIFLKHGQEFIVATNSVYHYFNTLVTT